MRSYCVCVLTLLLVVLAASTALAAVYGPDGGGYTADTEATFSWVDATGGTALGLYGDDEVSLALPIGFTFNFYGVDYTEFYVNTNGNIFFGSSSDDRAYNYSLQLAAPAGCIYAFAGDRAIYSEYGGEIYYQVFGDAPNRMLVIEWLNLQNVYYADDLAELGELQLDVEVILYEGTNEILVQFDNLVIDPASGFNAIINADGSSFLNASDVMEGLVTSGMAIKYTPGADTGATIVNAFPGRTHAGASYEWTLRLWNPGASAADYGLAVAGQTWTTTLSDTTVNVPAGGYVDATVTVEVPAGAAVGDQDTCTVTVTPPSKAKATLDLTTKVTPDFRQASDINDITGSLTSPAAVAYDGKIVVFGGYAEDTANTDVVREYDPATDTWTNIATMPAPDSDFLAEVVDHYAYLIGVTDYQGVSIYDFDTDTWSTGTDIPEPVDQEYSASAVSDGLIYVVGTEDTYDAAYVYDPAADTWTAIASAPEERYYHSLAALDGKLYVFGGYSAVFAWDEVASIEVYDIDTDSWTVIDSTEWRAARSYHRNFVKNGKIYLVGGYQFDYNLASYIPIFDPATKGYTFFDGFLPLDNYYFGFAATDDYAVVIGGYSENGYTLENQTWVLDLCDEPAADFTADATSVEEGEDIVFTSNDTGEAPCNYVTFAWDFGDGSTGDTDPVTHSYADAGTYSVTLTVTNAWGESEAVKADYITVTEAADDDTIDDDTTDDDVADDDVTDDDAGDDDATDDDASADDDDDDDTGGCGC